MPKFVVSRFRGAGQALSPERQATRSLRRLAAMAAALGVLVAGAESARADHSIRELVSAGGNGAFESAFRGASADGARVFFVTGEPLAGADADGVHLDVYERSGGVTSLVSAGGNGAFSAAFHGASADGSRVFFETDEQLTVADADTSRDVYERSGGVTQLLSAGGNGAFGAFFRGASADGSRVFLETGEPLTGADTDTHRDIFERSGGVTSLVSAGGNGAFHAFFRGVSADGSRAFIETEEPLTGADVDSHHDVYERSGGVTRLVSAGGNGASNASFRGASADGSRVFFATGEPLTGADTDGGRVDVYQRAGEVTSLVSAGGNGAFNASFHGTSADGSRVLLQTSEPLSGADADTSVDVYERAGGVTSLVSAGGSGAFNAFFLGASADGSRVWFSTEEPLTAADADGAQQDVYERSGGVTSLVSAGGNGPSSVFYRGASADGSRVFFDTDEALADADADGGRTDVYERSGGVTSLVSAGGNGAFRADFEGASADGSRVFFDTVERLAGGDTDEESDVYVARVARPPETTIDGGPEGSTGDATTVDTVAPRPPPGAPPALRDTIAPTLSAAAMRSKRFVVRRRVRSRTPVGTAFSFRLSEAATVRIVISPSEPGRRVRGRCVAPRRTNRGGRRCTRSSAQGTITRALPAGRATVAFSGRLARRTLSPGAYRATLVATDAAGNRSRSRAVSFTVATR